MRRMLMVAALIAAACAPAAPHSAGAQPQASIAACVGAAMTEDALRQCKGIVAAPCLVAPGGETTAAALQCEARERDQWSAVLDAEIARLEAESPERSAHLAAASAAWETWRQAECAYRASEYDGGSLANVLAASCFNDLTANRAIALILSRRARADQ